MAISIVSANPHNRGRQQAKAGQGLGQFIVCSSAGGSMVFVLDAGVGAGQLPTHPGAGNGR